MSELEKANSPENLQKTVDIIIPTYKPGPVFRELLKRLLCQTYPLHRIIVMNTEKEYWDDAVYESLFADTGIKPDEKLKVIHLTKPEFDHGGTRHQGFMEAEADACICMTQDALPKNKHLVGNLMAALYSGENVAIAYARQLPAADCGFIERYTRAFNYPKESRVKSKADLDKLGIKTYFCSNVCAAYRREIYLTLGGFIRKTIFNEDMIFAAKSVQNGYKIVYSSDAEAIHSHNYTAREQLHRNFDLAVSQADHPEVFSGLASEGEGLRLVVSTSAYLLKKGKWYLLPDLIIKSGFKYVGYRLGKMYRRLPDSLVRRLTMNQAYWD